LRMTPWTGGQGEIIVDVRSEISTLSALDPVTQLPEKSTRTADTTVRVKDGQTIVIGGLLQREQQTARSKIPVLGDLPLIGSLFRTKDVRYVQTDLAIFITCRILSPTGHLSEAEEARIRERFLSGESR